MYYFYYVVLLYLHIFIIIIRKTARERDTSGYEAVTIIFFVECCGSAILIFPFAGYGGRGGDLGGKGPQTSDNTTPDHCNHFGKIRIFRWEVYDWRIVKIHRVAKYLKNSWQRPWPEPLKLDRTVTVPWNPWGLPTTHANVETHAVALRHNFFA